MIHRSSAPVSIRIALAATVASLLGAAQSPAVLTLDLDTVNQTYRLLGSDTGTFDDFGLQPYKLLSWRTTSLGGGSFTNSLVGANNLWSSSVGSPVAGPNGFAFSIQVDPQLSGMVNIDLANTLNGPTTVSGLGITGSYASLAPANRLLLEGRIGTTMARINGTGFSGLQVVPEPASAGLLALGGLALLGRRRRSRR